MAALQKLRTNDPAIQICNRAFSLVDPARRLSAAFGRPIAPPAPFRLKTKTYLD